MAIVYKALRKLGLSEAAYTMLAPLNKGTVSDTAAEDAHRVLSEYSPDSGKSCIAERAATVRDDAQIDVDIIIPCYKVEKYLEDCIKSVLTQETKYSCRVIAIDDGSPDRSGEILDAYAAKDARMLVIHQGNKGLAGARNAGLERANARYIYFLDSDDVLCPGAIEKLLSTAEEQKAEMVEGGFNSIDVNGSIIGTNAHISGRMDADTEYLGFSCGKLYRRELFDGICFPEGYLFEDSLISHIILPRLFKENSVAYGVEDAVFGYRLLSTGIVRSSAGTPKSLDALWVHLRLFEDRRALGIEVDQSYYEYLLRMTVLTYHRTENQPEEIKKAILAVWREFFEKELGGRTTNNGNYKKLENALRTGDYGKYSLFCKLN